MSAFASCGRAVAHVRGSYVPISDIGPVSSGIRAKLVRRRDLASERRHNRVQKQGPIARREARMIASICSSLKAGGVAYGNREVRQIVGHHQENLAL